jgi:hypothetical protein
VATYFGNNQDGGSIDNLNGFVFGFNIGDTPASLFTCPGSGSQLVEELGCHAEVPSGTSNFRMALFDSSGNFVLQTDLLTCTETTLTWKTATSFLNQSKSPLSSPTITGGSTYTIVISADSSTIFYVSYTTVGQHNRYSGGDLATNGFGTTVPSWTNDQLSECYNIRCGVDPAGGSADWRKQGYWWDNPYSGRNQYWRPKGSSIFRPKHNHFVLDLGRKVA